MNFFKKKLSLNRAKNLTFGREPWNGVINKALTRWLEQNNQYYQDQSKKTVYFVQDMYK